METNNGTTLKEVDSNLQIAVNSIQRTLFSYDIQVNDAKLEWQFQQSLMSAEA